MFILCYSMLWFIVCFCCVRFSFFSTALYDLYVFFLFAVNFVIFSLRATILVNLNLNESDWLGRTSPK